MQTFIDPDSPRSRLSFEELARGVVTFPQQIVDVVGRERVRFAPEIFTEEYVRKSLEQQTLIWFYAGLPVAYKSCLRGSKFLASVGTKRLPIGHRRPIPT
jgi:hypothetical protein